MDSFREKDTGLPSEILNLPTRFPTLTNKYHQINNPKKTRYIIKSQSPSSHLREPMYFDRPPHAVMAATHLGRFISSTNAL